MQTEGDPHFVWDDVSGVPQAEQSSAMIFAKASDIICLAANSDIARYARSDIFAVAKVMDLRCIEWIWVYS